MLDLTSDEGRKAANKAVARAMGWKQELWPPHMRHSSTRPGKTEWRWVRYGVDGKEWEPDDPPDYLADDPALNDEMEKALPRLDGHDWWWCRENHNMGEGGVVGHCVRGWCVPKGVKAGGDGGMVSVAAGTEAVALVLALHKSGVVGGEETKGDGDAG